jgi:hypothetical protein
VTYRPLGYTVSRDLTLALPRGMQSTRRSTVRWSSRGQGKRSLSFALRIGKQGLTSEVLLSLLNRAHHRDITEELNTFQKHITIKLSETHEPTLHLLEGVPQAILCQFTKVPEQPPGALQA